MSVVGVESDQQSIVLVLVMCQGGFTFTLCLHPIQADLGPQADNLAVHLSIAVDDQRGQVPVGVIGNALCDGGIGTVQRQILSANSSENLSLICLPSLTLSPTMLTNLVDGYLAASVSR